MSSRKTNPTTLLPAMTSPPSEEAEKTVKCPFVVIADTREQVPYTFGNIRSDASEGGHRLAVQRIRLCIATGDYSVFGLPQVSVERKSLPDLFASVARRDNFVGRLERMSEQAHAAVVIEAEISAIMSAPPAFSNFNPKSLMRTILAWQMRYPVRWWFLPNRAAAETWTFRILERFYRDHKDQVEEAVFRTADGRKIPSRPIGGIGDDAAQVDEEPGPTPSAYDWGGQLWPEWPESYPQSPDLLALPLNIKDRAV